MYWYSTDWLLKTSGVKPHAVNGFDSFNKTNLQKMHITQATFFSTFKGEWDTSIM